jgi:hypothetical protein
MIEDVSTVKVPGQWANRYVQHSEVLREALCDTDRYGAHDIFILAHVGPNSVPAIADGTTGWSSVDILLGTVDALSEEAKKLLTSLGYSQQAADSWAMKQAEHTVVVHHAWLMGDHEQQTWIEPQVWRDFARWQSRDAKHSWDISAWDTPSWKQAASDWHIKFGPVRVLANLLKDAPFTWAVAAGWGLELSQPRATRLHEDIDLVVFYDEQLIVQSWLRQHGFTMQQIFQGQGKPWLDGDTIIPPQHQVKVEHHELATGGIDLLLSPRQNGYWCYRRDPGIQKPLAEAIEQHHGVFHLALDVALLHKGNSSLGVRPKDQRDFERVSPLLQPEQRNWLAKALAKTNPQHPWLPTLNTM